MTASKARGGGRSARWPDVACPAGSHVTARDCLHAVVFVAARADAPRFGGLLRLALRCATHGYETNLPPEDHCRRVLLAKAHADARDWDAVAKDLDH